MLKLAITVYNKGFPQNDIVHMDNMLVRMTSPAFQKVAFVWQFLFA